MIEYMIFGFVVFGCGYSCYKIGLKAGAANAIDVLYQQKIVAFDQAGNIKPNPFYKDR